MWQVVFEPSDSLRASSFIPGGGRGRALKPILLKSVLFWDAKAEGWKEPYPSKQHVHVGSSDVVPAVFGGLKGTGGRGRGQAERDWLVAWVEQTYKATSCVAQGAALGLWCTKALLRMQ